MKKLTILLSLIVLIYLASCTNTVDSEAGNPGITTAGLINMPTSVAQANSSRAAKDAVDDLYSYILDQNYFVNELINGDNPASVKSLLEEMATLPWEYITKWGNYDTTIGTEKFAMTYTENDTLPYYTFIADTAAGNAWKISASVNGDKEYIMGKVNYFIENPKEIFAESLYINLEFNKTAEGRYLDIKITQKVNPSASDFAGDEGQSWDYSLFEKDGILHISCGSYHPYIKDFFENAELCYIYTTVADTIANLAKVNLSLAPSDYNGTDSATLFGTYGAASAYSETIIKLLQDSTDDSTKMIIASSYKDQLPLDSVFIKMTLDPTYTLQSPSVISTMTASDLIIFLEVNENLSTEDFPVSDLLWLTKLSQPVFFDKDGYADNGSTFDAKFNTIAAINCTEEPKNPSLLKIQSLSFE